MFTLFCLHRGESVQNAFPIKLGKNELVHEIKSKIVGQQKFNHLATVNMTLWKANIPDDQAVDVKNFIEMLPTREIGDYFRTIQKRYIHVIFGKCMQREECKIDCMQREDCKID
jgi:Crinkler effector protein N-terminal domain